jgi:membrane-bound metal-dependent hydrolase YbcI (DUF457 family)
MMGGFMPSPIGHALGGVAVAWTAELLTLRPVPARLTVACAAAAVGADVDLLFPMPHRAVTHSLTAVAALIITAGVTGWVTRHVRVQGGSCERYPTRDHEWWIATVLGAAYASHLLFDWLGVDRSPPFGIQLLWPANHQWFYSGLDIFPATERRRFLSAASMIVNAQAIGQELMLCVPVLALLWFLRRRMRP